MPGALKTQEKPEVTDAPSVPELLEIIAQKDHLIEARDHLIEERDHLIAEQRKLLALMEEQLRLSRQRRFGSSSEKLPFQGDFFDEAELEQALMNAGKDELLASIRDIVPANVTCVYIRQGEPLGLGHAVLCARPAVGNEPFFVHLADDLIAGEPGCLEQMAEEYGRHGGSVIAVETVPPENTSSYGIVAVDETDDNRITEIVEKPQPEDAPSNLAVVGRYLLAPEIFDKLETTGRGAGGEIQLTDGIAAMIEEMLAYQVDAIVTACAGHTGIELDFGHDELHAREHLIPVNEGHPRGVRPGGIRTCGCCVGDPGGAQTSGRTDLLDIEAGTLRTRQ